MYLLYASGPKEVTFFLILLIKKVFFVYESSYVSIFDKFLFLEIFAFNLF